MRSKKRKPSSSRARPGRTKLKTAARSTGCEKDGVWSAKTVEMGIEMNEGKVTVLSEEMKTENNEEIRTEFMKGVGRKKQ